MAGTVAHDAHNLIVAGTNDANMCSSPTSASKDAALWPRPPVGMRRTRRRILQICAARGCRIPTGGQPKAAFSSNRPADHHCGLAWDRTNLVHKPRALRTPPIHLQTTLPNKKKPGDVRAFLIISMIFCMF
ncbi:hypothetical protein [Solidesulfovibrio fructosivorans]|uniref:hypothetical protein n=1 Tax=Solidesulfovibrio fructosivorans TaxID=878 RepID=UPI00117CA9AF